MPSYRNTIIDYEGRAYELFWTSQNAKHVCQSFYSRDGMHLLDHEAIARVTADYDHVQEFPNGRCVFLSRYQGQIYEIHVHLERGTAKRPGRCTIKTCYKSNKQQYLELFK